MSLTSGSRLGPYEISGKLGEGGMGEVYRARDTRLGRTVAIKVLPAFLAGDVELRARFEREARAISSLQHPHICTLFDVGREGERDYLVMEYLEGEPLTTRLSRGPLALEETLRFGRQIAEALDKAHRQGIVHRDLKPGNVIVTRSGVKLLDFGLAKLQVGLTRPTSAAGQLDSRTVLVSSEPLTTAGTVVGTPEYMAPEQLEGRDTDARCDLWALGCVLYQMVTGERPFARANLASVITAVMSSEPALPASAAVPQGLERLIRFCLAKDPEQRWQSAYDLALELESLSGPARDDSVSGGSAMAPPANNRSRWRQLGLGLAALALVAGFWWRASGGSANPLPRPVFFQLPPPPGVEFYQSVEVKQLAVSPDGRTLAFVGFDAGRVPRVYLRPVAAIEAKALAGTEGASSLFWSPDGKTIAFFATGKLKRIELAGGAPFSLCEVDRTVGYAGTWSREGQIVFASVQGKAMMKIAATGGVAEKILEPDQAQQEARITWPLFLPDGKRLLYLLRKQGEDLLMLLEPTGEKRLVGPLASRFELLGPDRLVYCSEGALLTRQFDAAAGKLLGTPQALAPAVRYFFSSGWAGFAASPQGGLFYVTGADSMRFYAYGRGGERQELAGSSEGAYLSLALSEDGKSLLTERMQPMYGTYDIWQLDLERSIETRLTSTPAAEFAPILLPGAKSMIYSVARAGTPNVVRRALLNGDEEPLLPSPSFQQPMDVSAAGDLLAYAERAEKGGFRGMVMNLVGEPKARQLFPEGTDQDGLRFSPDARYLAFLSNDSGEIEAYVAPLDSPNDRIRLSRHGATRLRWRGDGREIVWVTPQGEVVAAGVSTSPKLTVGEPAVLFTLPADAKVQDFDIEADGDPLILLIRERRGGAQPASVLLDWSPEADS